MTNQLKQSNDHLKIFPPPGQTPQGTGTPLTEPSTILVQNFQEVFAAKVPTVRHIPSMWRAAIGDELAKLVSEGDAAVTPTWEAHVLFEVGVGVLKARGTEILTQDGA